MREAMAELWDEEEECSGKLGIEVKGREEYGRYVLMRFKFEIQMSGDFLLIRIVNF